MSLPTNYIRINCNGPFHFISAPPPLLRVKEILGGGRGPLAVISEGVAMLVTLIFLFFLKGGMRQHFDL